MAHDPNRIEVGFASFKDGTIELIFRRDYNEVTITKGRVSKGDRDLLLDILATCVFVPVEPHTRCTAVSTPAHARLIEAARRAADHIHQHHTPDALDTVETWWNVLAALRSALAEVDRG